jgi:nicotinamidase-related amidase
MNASSMAFLLIAGLLALPSGPTQAASFSDLDEHTALLIIDIQAFYYPEGAVPLVSPEAASANAKRLLDRFREEGMKVIHVGHNVREGGAFHPDVAPLEVEKVFMKDEVSAFNGTELDSYLRAEGITRLVICGMQTHMCVEGATRAAYDLGFEVIVVGDACATRDLEYGDQAVPAASVHASTLATIHRIYAEVVETGAFLEHR